MEFINRNPKIIILSGKAQSGKNYCASIISDYYGELGLKTISKINITSKIPFSIF